MFTTKKIFHYLLVISVVLSACKKETDDDNDDDDNNNTTVGINSTPQWSATIDGTEYLFTEDGNISNGQSEGGEIDPQTGIATYGYGSDFREFGSSTILGGIGKDYVNFLIDDGMTNQEFSNFFNPGTYSYGTIPEHGVQIYWSDASGTLWTSYFGTANQTGSTFSIVEKKEETLGGNFFVKVHATFSCKLYDDNGNSKTLTNGVCIGHFSSNY